MPEKRRWLPRRAASSSGVASSLRRSSRRTWRSIGGGGGEIGRAQPLQALAAGLAPHSDFNPVLLKPTTDKTAQIIIHGQVAMDLDARDYHAYKPRAMGAVLASWGRLTATYEAVLVEGAGSPAENNLRDRDIANMGFAEAGDCPVILIADIDRGGVFAHLVATLDLLSPSEQNRVKGFVINRFRGDIGLLQPGLDWLEQRTGKPVLGVLPYLHGLMLDAEDAIAPVAVDPEKHAKIKIVAPVVPRISNHNDLDPLRLHPEVDFRWVGPGEAMPAADLIVLPGSKAVRADLDWLRAQGREAAIKKHLHYGGKLIGPENRGLSPIARREADLDRLADAVEAGGGWQGCCRGCEGVVGGGEVAQAAKSGR